MLPVALVPVPGEGRFPGHGDTTSATCGSWHSQTWHCHTAAPQGHHGHLHVVTNWALLHPGVSGGQRREEPSSTCSQLSWPFGHHFAANGQCNLLCTCWCDKEQELTGSLGRNHPQQDAGCSLQAVIIHQPLSLSNT